MTAYRTMLFKAETKEQRKQDKLSTRINKALAGSLKPSDTEIIDNLRKESLRYV